MRDDEYAKLKRDFRKTQNWDTVYPVIKDVVARATRSGRIPAALSPTGSWTPDSRAEALHEWIATRLLPRKDLMSAFDFASSPGPFYKSLERSFRHFLLNAEESTEAQNLVERARELMRDETGRFAHWELSAASWWGLRAWRDVLGERLPDVWQESDDMLIAHAWACGSFVIVRYGPGVNRASPILMKDELGRFLEAWFARLGRPINDNHLRTVFIRRFAAGTAVTAVDIDERDSGVDENPVAAIEEQELEATAVFLLEEITARQAEVLLLLRDKTLDQVAEALEIARGTVANERDRIRQAAERVAGNYPPESVLEKLIDILSIEI